MTDFRITNERVVSTAYSTKPIDENTPMHKFMYLVTVAGIAMIAKLTPENKSFFGSWAPLPARGDR